MSVYTIEHAISECINDKLNVTSGSRGSTIGAKNEIYWESWSAMNSWIESILSKKKGANIPMLGVFSWEVKDDNGANSFRPIFLVSESFVKDHRVRRQRIHQPPQVANSEEINFSQIAIKYTNSLTKDMVYSGIRDIIRKIGDFVDRVYEFEIEFTFGKLKSKERRVKFEFNQTRLAQILPENLFSATSGTENFEIFDESNRGSTHKNNLGNTSLSLNNVSRNSLSTPASTSRSDISSASSSRTSTSGYSSNTNLRSIQMQRTNNINPMPTLSTSLNNKLDDTFQSFDSSANTASLPVPPSSYTNSNLTLSNNNSSSEGSRPISPGIQRILEAMETQSMSPTTIADRRKRGQDKVTELAYLRCLNQFEAYANEGDYISSQSRQLQKDFEVKERAQRDKQRGEMKRLQQALDGQINDFRSTSNKERDDRMAATMSILIPPPADETGTSSLKAAEKKMSFSKDLKSQMNNNASRKLLQKMSALEEEKDYLDHVQMEFEMLSTLERAEHLQKQKQLLEAWERDGHIRNLRKLQSCGASTVKNYINLNMYDVPQHTTSSTGPSMGRSGSGNMAAMSVGYDPRKIPKL